jgi:hypothetical protein
MKDRRRDLAFEVFAGYRPARRKAGHRIPGSKRNVNHGAPDSIINGRLPGHLPGGLKRVTRRDDNKPGRRQCG